MSHLPVKRNDIARRPTEHGRLRTGDRGGNRGAPRSLPHWRLTSSDEAALEQVAEVYGGRVTPWNQKSSHHTYELTTQSEELRIALPPNALHITDYQMWKGGDCLRLCDGETVRIRTVSGSPDGAEPDEEQAPCICWAKQVMECGDRRLRLNVLLPDVKVGGTWRLETGSYHALTEIPSMVDLIQMAQGAGIPYATLRLEARQSPGKRYRVPVLGLSHTLEELASGVASVGALQNVSTAPPPAALTTGDSASPDGRATSTAEIGPAAPLEVIDVTEVQVVTPTSEAVCAMCTGEIGSEAWGKLSDGTYAHERCL